MQTALQRHAIQSPAMPARPQSLVGSSQRLRPEESDDIDDILCSLWPTSSIETGRPMGMHTPPEDFYAIPLVATSLPPSPVASVHSKRPSYQALRPVAIQIGDPEWRIDSPLVPRLPSPDSPGAAPAMFYAPKRPELAGVRPQPTSLGLGHMRGPATARSATLGLLPVRAGVHSSQPQVARMVTPAERSARLNTVSGLAAKAVARRCLSGQIPATDADLMLRQAMAAGPPPAFKPTQLQVAARKPTFADIARGASE
ncbi:hypothetical protein GGI07_002080 [Coemansia sp. Benny D115]|nr:hypothetical protein GGI07_002080 [Coemansia sp. Benny D115]